MRRLLLTFTFLVLVGAVANLLLAISATHAAQVPRAPVTNVIDANAGTHGWPDPPPGDWPAVSQWSETRAFGFRRLDAWSAKEGATTHQMELREFGWPLPVLKQVRLWWPWNDSKWATSANPDSGLVFSWSGLLVNPVLFAAAVGFALFVPFHLFVGVRRLLRRRRGLCTHCGYPIGSSPACTECGADVSHLSAGRRVA